MAGLDDVIDREPDADWLWREDQQRYVEQDGRWHYVPSLPNHSRIQRGNKEYGIPFEHKLGIYAGKTPSYYPPNVDNEMERDSINNYKRGHGLYNLDTLRGWFDEHQKELKAATKDMSTIDLLNQYAMQTGTAPEDLAKRIKEAEGVKTEKDLRKWLEWGLAYDTVQTRTRNNLVRQEDM